MKTTRSIRLKAAFLLLVFTLNTAIGFACSMGVDMGFNKHHYDHGEEALPGDVSQEVEGHQNEGHHNEANEHHEDIDHHHEAGDHHHLKKEGCGDHGCCNDTVVKFQQLDKNLIATAFALYVPLFVPVPGVDFHCLPFATLSIVFQKRVIRHYYPPPPDIRVSIQSFQI
ncbi:hypothetical protein ACX0G9_07270 [Flavitalea flava]